MNTCVAKYAPKNKTYCKSISLETRVKVAAGIYTVGYHFFWIEVMKELQMEISPHFESYLLQRDEKKVSKFNREHTKRQKTLRKKREHEKLRKELDKRFRDVAKNLLYSSMIGCNSDDPKTNTKKTAERKICKHASYGCTPNTTKEQHKTERSKHCIFNGKTAEYIAKAKATYENETTSKGNAIGFDAMIMFFFMYSLLYSLLM